MKIKSEKKKKKCVTAGNRWSKMQAIMIGKDQVFYFSFVTDV